MPKQTFALFFTTKGRSLENWDRLGMLDRELKLYQHTASQFDRLYFFTYGGKRDLTYANRLPSNVCIVPKPRLLPIMLYSFLLPLLHRKILRTVHILKTNQMDGSWSAVIAKKLYGGKLIVRCGYEWLQFIERSNRGWVKRSAARAAERYAYRNADVIVQTSQEAAQFARDRFSIPDGKITVIPNYIDVQRFAPSAAVPAAGSIIYVGRLESQKNLPHLIDALANLPVTLTVVGKGSLRELLQQQAEERGVSIRWKGTIPQAELPHELGQHELFVLPSLYEGSPKTLLEAMSCGMPCVATNVTGNKEVVKDGVNGIICNTDAVSIRQAIQRVLSDGQLRARIGSEARITILNTYSFEKILEQELSVYTAL